MNEKLFALHLCWYVIVSMTWEILWSQEIECMVIALLYHWKFGNKWCRYLYWIPGIWMFYWFNEDVMLSSSFTRSNMVENVTTYIPSPFISLLISMVLNTISIISLQYCIFYEYSTYFYIAGFIIVYFFEYFNISYCLMNISWDNLICSPSLRSVITVFLITCTLVTFYNIYVIYHFHKLLVFSNLLILYALICYSVT